MKKSHRLNQSQGSAALAMTSALFFLVGCGGFSNLTETPTPLALHMSGALHGGQQAISNSNIYLYSVGSTQGGASTSMLTTNGGYVTTDSNGNFSITGDYTCPSGNTNVSTYILALGGNPGTAGNTSNSAIALMAALGPCSGLASTPFVWIDEVSTAAAVTSLQQFMVDSTHIGAYTVSSQPGYSAVASIPNAMTTVNNLVAVASGEAIAAPVNGNGTSPQAKLNTLGNILSGCVNSLSPTSTACTNLFSVATPTGGTRPTDTIGAMLLIARNPGNNVSTLFSQSLATAPFQPALSTAPNDFSLAISYTGGTLTYPGPLVIDNAGDVWIANCPSCNGNTSSADSIVGFTPAGGVITTPANYVTNVHKPVAIAIDRYNGIWVAEAANSSQGNQLTRLNNTDGSVEYPVGNNSSAPTVGFPYNLPGVPAGIALVEDTPADAWVTDTTDGKMLQIKYDGTLLNTVTTTGMSNPTTIVADGLNNLYLIGTGSNNIVQYSSGGTLTSYNGAGISTPAGLAADGGDHIWAVDQGTTKAVSEIFGYTGAATSGSSGYAAGINTASGISIDGAGTAWIANCRVNCGSTGADNILHLSASGASMIPSDGLQSSTLTKPTATAIDISGNLWVSSTGGANITEVVGVAVPVVTELETASSRAALGVAANYLQDGGFEQGTVGAANVLDWTYSSSTSTTGVAAIGDCNSNCPFAGNQRLTFYTGTNPFQATESQTISVPNGNYMFSCYVTGNASVDVSLTATSNGVTTTNTLANLTYGWTPYSIPNIAVTSGSLTVGLNASGNTGFNYTAFDACSVTQQ